jgi:hypothetical protein
MVLSGEGESPRTDEQRLQGMGFLLWEGLWSVVRRLVS